MWNQVIGFDGSGSGAAVEVEGTCAHDSADPGTNPIHIGSQAQNETPAAVADGDCCRWYVTLEGRGVVVQDLLNAGEDLVNDVVRTVPGALSVEEHSLDFSYLAGSATNQVVKASAGRAYIIVASNPTGGTLYLQLHNLAAAPGGGAVPMIAPIPVPAGGVASLDLNEYGQYCSVGITVASSSVFATFTGSSGLHITTWFK